MCLSRRSLVKGLVGGAAVSAFPQFSYSAGRDGFQIGYFVPDKWEDIQYPARLEWLAWANLVSLRLQPLVRLAGENQIEYVLAERIYENGLGDVWYVEIKPDVFWNGPSGREPFTLEQVEANILSWMADSESQIGAEFRRKVKAVALDVGPSGRQRLKIELVTPNHQFFYAFTSYAALMGHPEEKGVFTPTSRGTGPFRVDAFEEGQFLRFVPEPSYWDTSRRALFPVTFWQEQSASSSAFDFIPEVSPDRWKQLQGEGMALKQNPLADALVFHMDCREGLFQDPSVRQALRFLVDPQVMIASVYGMGRAADHTHVASIHLDAPVGRKKAQMYDPDRARQLLGGRTLAFPLFYPVRFAWQKNAAEAYASEAAKVGVSVTPVPCGEEFANRWNTYRGGMTSIKWHHRPLAQQLFSKVYETNAEWNLSGWSHPGFDKAVAELVSAPLNSQASDAMETAMTLLQDEGPMVNPLWFDCNKGYNPEKVMALTVQVGSGGYIYAEKLRRIA